MREVLDRKLWEAMLRAARDLDIDEGGLYDARSGAILIWASPEDRPDDPWWRGHEITKGCLNYPRALVGGVYVDEYRDKEVVVELRVHNDEKRWDAEERCRRGEISWKEYKAIAEECYRGTEAEWEWLLRKYEELKELAKGLINVEEVLMCPYCGEEVRALYDLVAHLTSVHGARVDRVVWPDSLVVEGRVLALEDLTKLRRVSHGREEEG
mgnify:CR=1 FL=1